MQSQVLLGQYILTLLHGIQGHSRVLLAVRNSFRIQYQNPRYNIHSFIARLVITGRVITMNSSNKILRSFASYH